MMRAPARLFGISLTVFIALTIILSRFESETVTRTINKFPGIKQQWQARSAAMQSHFSSSPASSLAASNMGACDADAKTCSEPYTSHDGLADEKPSSDQTMSEKYESEEAMEHTKDSKDRRPSTKDQDRDKDRGFTDAEQAAALERLEFKYGAEAKADETSLLWMETSTTHTWGTDPTAAPNSEVERARKKLVEEYGEETDATTTTTTTAESEETEKGWRTTGFETRVKSSQKTLVDGGGGNGTATGTAAMATSLGELMEEAVGTATSTGKKAKTTGKGKWADKAAPAEAEEVVTEVVVKTAEKTAKATKTPSRTQQKAKPAADNEEDDEKSVEHIDDSVDFDDVRTEKPIKKSTKASKPTQKASKGEKQEAEELGMWKKASKPSRKKLKAMTDDLQVDTEDETVSGRRKKKQKPIERADETDKPLRSVRKRRS